ncbi:MAG: para-aminobenzoate synthase, subunit [Acidimicrobiia bacterium]|nr:para-aminobenzoate synthase, subunit [Acidimicrobiia bacterium]
MVRLDDMRQTPAVAWQFEGLRQEIRADSVSEVAGALHRAEAAAAAGHWVVGFVCYEAAPAFDDHLPVADRGEQPLPLVWFGVFTDRVSAASLDLEPDPAPALTGRTQRRPGPLSYRAAVQRVRGHIEAGDVYQVNLAERAEGTLGGDPWSLYVTMMRAQRGAYGAYLDLGPQVVVSASPELFFQWDERGITARPMKGTAARHPDPAIDAEVGRRLQHSPKDRAENVMIVDLLRNDLSRLAVPHGVSVPDLFTLERYETVWQLTSSVRAVVAPHITVADVFAAVFPCGSITGAPKRAAMSLIADLEGIRRGVYCGAIGYIAPPGQPTKAVFSVPIRTAVVERQSSRLTFGVGAGITWLSTPEAEDAEVDSKCRVLDERRPTFALLDTMRHDESGIRHLERHLTRLHASAHWFGYELDVAALRCCLTALPPPAAPMRLRVLVQRDGTTTVEHEPLLPVEEPVRLALDRDHPLRSDDVFCRHKTTVRGHYEEARARHPEAGDVILLNERGELMETTTANLAVCLSGRWFTPARSCGGLPGVGREVLLETGQLHERLLDGRDLGQAEGVAVINDLRGWRTAALTASA